MEQRTLSGSTVKEDKRFDDMFGLLAQIFTTPTKTALTGNPSTSLGFEATTERMVRMFKIVKSDLTAKQAEKELFKLTDAEKLAILSNASLNAPLDHDAFKEYSRLFYIVKGKDAYESVFGEGSTPPDPPYYDLFKGK